MIIFCALYPLPLFFISSFFLSLKIPTSLSQHLVTSPLVRLHDCPSPLAIKAVPQNAVIRGLLCDDDLGPQFSALHSFTLIFSYGGLSKSQLLPHQHSL